jgi:hypothetical protein
MLRLVRERDDWIADRDFCTTGLLFGTIDSDAFFVIRHHANMTRAPCGPLKKRGRTETGDVYEQAVSL